VDCVVKVCREEVVVRRGGSWDEDWHEEDKEKGNDRKKMKRDGGT
jgi:hypothetical protein